MLLSARMLSDVFSVNSFRNVDSASYTSGDSTTLYFQLIDASVDTNLRPVGRRFIPAAGATLQVVLHSIDDAKTVTRYATQPFANDPSIWALQIQSTDTIRGTCSMKLTLTEVVSLVTTITHGFLDTAVRVYSQTQAR